MGHHQLVGRGARGPRVVAFGGGHGLYASLSALRLITQNLTAVVTVADDGGSSGRLREEFSVLPPGDLRMALSALCDESEWGQTWRDVLQHRFTSRGPLDGHALGNLLILSLWEQLDDTVQALDWVGQLLRIRGRVLPMSSIPLEIEAKVSYEGNVRQVRGQVAVAKAGGHVEEVSLIPHNPPAQPEAIEAIKEAEWIIFGPGSWYSSVIPHLLVPELASAVCTSKAKKVVALNLNRESETMGMDAAEHIRSFHRHAPNLKLDVVIADPSSVESILDTEKAVQECGAQLMLRQVRSGDDVGQHDFLRLAAAYRDAFEGVLGDVV
ncbi:MAG: uridine diphosphate-N-acetylglucosamine-binding protein YvcK [Actinomycetaceae bacterium]|nr:uridine diphosphate-N-acetylglucosamine-binding protein YvcK [Actinomycetaceae bacterium]